MRRWELLPEVVLGLGLGFFLLTESDAATSALQSGRAIALMAVTGVAWLAARLVLGRLPSRWAAARTGVFAVAAAGVLAVVVLPAYDDTTVVEVLAEEPAPTTSSTTPVVPDPAVAPPASTTPTTAAPTGPVVLAEGELAGIDHRAEGLVRLYEQPSGQHVVGLEEIDIQPGPDYDVYLVPGAGQEDRGDGVRLDDLRGNKGTQYYDVPAGTDVSTGEWTVLVWCQTFGVPVAAATPT